MHSAEQPTNSQCNNGSRIRLDLNRITQPRVTVTPIKDETGKLIGMAAVMRDATKQFQEMRALRRKLNER
jgi:signal transduction histidine kinase